MCLACGSPWFQSSASQKGKNLELLRVEEEGTPGGEAGLAVSRAQFGDI